MCLRVLDPSPSCRIFQLQLAEQDHIVLVLVGLCAIDMFPVVVVLFLLVRLGRHERGCGRCGCVRPTELGVSGRVIRQGEDSRVLDKVEPERCSRCCYILVSSLDDRSKGSWDGTYFVSPVYPSLP